MSDLTARQLKEWEVYYSLEPFGDIRADMRSGIIAAAIANFSFHRTKKSKVYKADDFMPKFEQKRDKKPDWRKTLKQVEQLNLMFGGKDLRKK